MIYAKLHSDGTLTDISWREPVTWDDGSTDVPLLSMPADRGPWGYDAQNQVAIPFVPPLPVYQANKIAALNVQAIGIVETRYPSAIMAAFAGLLASANASNKPNQAAYCQKLLTWGTTVIQAYATAAGQVQAATNIAGVDAVNLDVNTLIAGDPGVNLPTALAITN